MPSLQAKLVFLEAAKPCWAHLLQLLPGLCDQVIIKWHTTGNEWKSSNLHNFGPLVRKSPGPQWDSVEFFYVATIQSTYSRLRRGYRVTVLSRLTGIKIGVSRLGLKSCDEISRIKPLRRRCRKSIIVRCLNNNVGLFSFLSEQHLDLKVLAAKAFCNTDERKVFH